MHVSIKCLFALFFHLEKIRTCDAFLLPGKFIINVVFLMPDTALDKTANLVIFNDSIRILAAKLFASLSMISLVAFKIEAI